jgi:hypothetical protein
VERLDLDRGNERPEADRAAATAEIEVEPAAVAAGANDLLELGGQVLDRLLEPLVLRVEVLGEVAEMPDVVAQRGSRVLDEARGHLGELPDRHDRLADRLPVLGQAGDQRLQRADQLRELLVARVHRLEHRVQIVDHLADHLVAVGERVGQRRRAGEQALDGAALALQHLDDLERELVHLLRIESGEQRLEPVEQHGEVERRAGALDRDRAACRQHLACGPCALLEREVALPDEVAVEDRRPRRRRDRLVGRHAELHLGEPPVDDPHVVDGADDHARDPDVVAAEQAAGVDEAGRVGRPRAAGGVGDGQGEHRGGQRHDHREREELDQRAERDPPHVTVTSVPR